MSFLQSTQIGVGVSATGVIVLFPHPYKNRIPINGRIMNSFFMRKKEKDKRI
jgi:hypothetical protein